ncbi:hypothetical protein M0R04_11365 [Candidatus Dojkabacteria bacterium]|jgi:hypothetical protein|nr:hypothetical protein [Candidatus Dojkabacteria bacterium]
MNKILKFLVRHELRDLEAELELERNWRKNLQTDKENYLKELKETKWELEDARKAILRLKGDK